MMRIVILGGGFCGALLAKELDKQKHIEVVLVDKKEYFEYSPSLWKLLLNPENHKNYIVPFSQFLRRTRLITTPLRQVTPTFVETETEKLTFDYLVISTGIEYPISLHNTQNVFAVKSGVDIVQNSREVAAAKTILIIGGGLIGTEIAGELATKSPEKQIIIVHSHDRLLERNRNLVSKYAKKFLEKRGVKIIFGEQVIDHQNGTFVTDTKRTIQTDVGIWCAGIKSNPWYMKAFPTSIFSEENALKVNRCLQLEGYPFIFVGGDITNIPEEKTAANAERHGQLIAVNILRSLKQKRLIRYRPRKEPMIISLGRTDAILTYSVFMVPGFLPAIIKWAVEKVGIKRLSFFAHLLQ
jgi:NADH dehydrogenase FAD-containing subunit